MLLAAFILSACTAAPTQSVPTVDIIGTKVAQTMTALPTNTPQPTQALPAKPSEVAPTSPQPSETLAPTPTPTTPPDDPKASLGSPAWKNTLDSGSSFGLDAKGYDDGNTRIAVANGVMTLTSIYPSGYRNWRLTGSLPSRFYLEGKFNTINCSGGDQYGLVFRAPDYTSGYGFYFIVTCDGKYTLVRADANGNPNRLFDWVEEPALLSGSGQTNNLGVMAIGDKISLYANGKLLREVNDAAFQDGSRFGVYIAGQSTPNFTYELDEIAYWNIP